MSSPRDVEALESLKIAFCDEDTDVWTHAARRLGALAAHDDDARAFLVRWLSQSDNVHRFRHACCALASYASQEATTDPTLMALRREQIVTPLVSLALGSLGPDATLAALDAIPGARLQYDAWAHQRAGELGEKIAEFERAGRTRAAEANRGKLAALGDQPTSPIPDGFKPSAPKLDEHAVWAVASYFAGVEHTRALDALPLEKIVDALSQLGASRQAAGLPLVLGLPPMMVRLGQQLDPTLRERIVRRLEDIPRSWSSDRLHYNDYVMDVASLGARSFRGLWQGDRILPTWLSSGLDDIERLGGDARSANRRSAALMRQIAERCFSDDWRWEELDHGTRFALNVYALLAVHGPQPIAGAPLPPLGRSHRIALVVDAMTRGFEAREQVLPTLVRCLKLLLDEELAANRTKPTLVDVCRRQIVIVQPLVAQWRLPRTLRKDLATIVCRVLLAVFERDRAAFAELLYAVLYALPDQVLFRQMIEYSTEPAVTAMLEAIVAGIDHWQGDGDVDGAWQRYGAYVDLLFDSCGDVAPWSKELVGVLRLLSRSGATAYSARDVADSYSGLSSVLRAKQTIVHAGESTPTRKGDRKGAQWAAREQERQVDHATSATFDRFQRLLDDIQILESDCLPEVGHPKPTDDLVRRWRRLISALDDLARLCAAELPYLEREMSTHLLRRKVGALERRLFVLMRVLEKEEEDVAITLLAERAAATASAAAPAEVTVEDADLVQEWMLGRYMVRELASTLRFRVLGLLTSPTFVAVWLLAPFAACILLHLAGWYRWRGFPFAAVTVANVFLVLAYFFESRRTRAVTAGTARFLLPQITAALFLGIMEVLASDEAWSLAVLEFPWVRGFTIFSFLLAGFFFTREVLLGRQLASKSETKKKSRRAASVMALVLWQSFVLVVLFALISGRVMGDRADLDLEHLHRLASAWGQVLPHEVHLGRFFLAPAEENALYPESPAYRIFPWAILTWTVQVFFFSAIFERIMRGRE